MRVKHGNPQMEDDDEMEGPRENKGFSHRIGHLPD